MMNVVNKKIGNEYETKFAEVLQNKGFWCHIFEYNKNGQPCDIVAIRNNIGHLYDVKHCDKDRFSFDKIQPNQLTCFEYAKQCGNEISGFAIWFEKQQCWFYLSYAKLLEEMKKGSKSVSYMDLEKIEKNCYEAVIRDTSCDEEDKTYFFKIRFKADDKKQVLDWLKNRYEYDPLCFVNEVYAIRKIDETQSALNGIQIVEL